MKSQRTAAHHILAQARLEAKEHAGEISTIPASPSGVLTMRKLSHQKPAFSSFARKAYTFGETKDADRA